jgi:peroxiredoxin family protein
MGLMQVPVPERTNQELNKVTVGLLFVVTILATKTRLKHASLALVLALNGATFGNLLSLFITPLGLDCFTHRRSENQANATIQFESGAIKLL